jgi:endonuclease/exonuclease/phosphatase family metal-dependent hydrolase
MTPAETAQGSPPPRRRRWHRRVAFAGLTLAFALQSCGLLRCSHGSDYTQSPLFGTSPPRWPQDHSLRVVTWNIHDLYWLSEHRAERMAAIAQALAALQPDVVCLQEGFVAGDVAVIASALHDAGIEHAIDFPAGVVGSGLWTFSRFPVHDVFFHQFTQNGAMFDTRGGDWWAGKGVGLTRLELADGQFVDVYNTHMICGLGGPALSAHRRVQVREYAAFVLGATPANVPALLLGDFNCGPGSPDYRFLDDALRWRPLLQGGSWLDHVTARTAHDAYRFPVAEQVPIGGNATIAAEPPKNVALSDHTGWLVAVRIEPASAEAPAGAGPTPGIPPAGR